MTQITLSIIVYNIIIVQASNDVIAACASPSPFIEMQYSISCTVDLPCIKTMAISLSLLGLLLVLGYGSTADNHTVTVYPQNCTEKRRDSNVTLNHVLNGTVTSDTYYQLLEGVHCIVNFRYVQDLHNVTFAGDSTNPERIIVTCVANTGLGFINMSLLKLEGLTITDCGIAGKDNFDLFQSRLKYNSNFFYELHSFDVIAILVGLVSNFTVHSVTVSATKGLGMLVVNPQSNTLLDHCTFSINHPLACYRLPLDNTASVNTTEESNHIGGGAYFVFVNFNKSTDNKTTSLKIQNSTFLNNSYCGLSAVVAVTYKVEGIVSDVANYSLGAGGGLSVILAQTQYSVNVTIDSTTFRNNTSYLGGGAHIAMFEGIGGNQILFLNSEFIKNGLEGDILTIPQFYTSGSGLYVLKDLVFPTNEDYTLTSKPLTNTIHLKDCNMTGNRASYAAAINIYSIYGLPVYDIVFIDNCILSENEAIVGAAIYVGELKQNGLQPGIQIILNDVNVTKNKIIFEDSTENIATISKSDSSAAIEIQSVNITFRGNNSLISNNYATAIRSQSSVIYIHDHIVICNNSGSFGGAMNLIAASYVVLRNNSHLRLENNTGVVEGGAIYVNLLAYSPDFSYRDCFLFFREVEAICFGPSSCSNVSLLNFTLELIDNTSPLGSLIFGSTLDTCPWSLQLKDMFHKPPSYPVLDIMYQMTEKFYFSSPPTTVNAVTTPTNKLVIHNLNSERSYAPGELFYLNVTAYDHLNQSTPVLLSSRPSTSNNIISSSLGFSNFSFLDGSPGDRVPVIVTGMENVSNVMIHLYATDSYTQIAFQVNLTNCSVGFEYSDGRCQCEEEIRQHSDFGCNSTSMTLSVPNNHWAGPGPDDSLIIALCISDFCSIGEREVKPPDFNSLCHDGYMRSGILCGKCVEGYSMTLGSHHCKKCDNHYISLIIIFAVAGVLIMCGILFLHITVSDGYLNSILFYTNILSIYIPVLSSTSQNATIFVIVAWLNLDYGIESCFYDGMTTLTHVALRLVFPFYLVLLMLLVILVSNKSKVLSRIFSRAQFSAAKMFATILLMSYATILEVCLELMSPIVLTSVDNQEYVRWRSDANQAYFRGLHIPLMILACVLLVVVILPSPIVLMFPKIAFSTRIGVRMKPILDAFWAPFKTRYRFFVGLRLLLRMIPYSIAYLIEQPMNILFLGIFSISMLFFQVVIQPFDGFLHNTLDGFFLTNIVMIVMGALYFQIYITAHQENRGYVKYHHKQFVYFTQFVTMAYVAFLLVFLWHIQRRFPSIRRTFTSLLSKIRIKKSNKDMIDITETTPIIHAQDDGDNTSLNDGHVISPRPIGETNNTRDLTHHDGTPPPPIVNYYILREPLLEEGVADLVPVTS